MDDATLTSSTDATMMDRHILEQLMMIRPLLRKEGSNVAAGGGIAARGDVVEEIAKECMALNKDQSKDLLLAVLLDVLLLHLLDDEEEGRVEVPTSAASDQQLMDNAAAVKKKKAAAAAKKKQNKRNKAAAKQKHKRGSKRMIWLGNGIIPRIMMVFVGSITTLLVALSLIHQSDGSSEGKAPPALRPSTITSLRQRDLQSISMPSTSPNIMSPSPIPVVPIFSLTERNALSDFYDSAKGADWINGSLWLDESTSYCDWKGVTCDEMNHVIKLQLSNNGLSGRLSESIGNLTFIEVLDLSDNYIKGPIPAEIGKLTNLTYLRLCYNAFTGVATESLEELTKLQLLHLQSNRITIMPTIPRLSDSIHGLSTFVTYCGEPSALDNVLDCDNCTMCCNTNDDCCPQLETQTVRWGMNYHSYNAFFFAVFFAYGCLLTIYLYICNNKCEDTNIPLSPAMEAMHEEEDDALSKICSDSVYSYFVTDNVFGWKVALVTVGVQLGILAVFIRASEFYFQDEIIDVQFTWKCPPDTDTCTNKADLTNAGWYTFAVLMSAFLAKDFLGGYKLLLHSATIRHPFKSRIRYFFGGMCLTMITLTAFYASAVYNRMISTSNIEIILNSVIILFVMALDEAVFLALKVWNPKRTEHVDIKARFRSTIDEMKNDFEVYKAQIASQREEMGSTINEMKNDFELYKAQIASQRKEMGRKTDELKNDFELYKAQIAIFFSVKGNVFN